MSTLQLIQVISMVFWVRVRYEERRLYLLSTFKHARKKKLVKIAYLHGLGLWTSSFAAKLIALSL